MHLISKIFGDRGFRADFGDFDQPDSKYGFGSAKEIIMTLSFAEAARGVQKTKTINVVDTCPKCQGSKASPGTKPGRCQSCNGSGMETISTGPFIMRSTCRYCAGSGQYNRYPCIECDGKGMNVQRKTVNIPVPAGVENGQTVRMTVGKQEIFITFKLV